MDTVLKVKKDYFLLCGYLLARAFVQMLEQYLEAVVLPILDPQRFLSCWLAESGSLTFLT